MNNIVFERIAMCVGIIVQLRIDRSYHLEVSNENYTLP